MRSTTAGRRSSILAAVAAIAVLGGCGGSGEDGTEAKLGAPTAATAATPTTTRETTAAPSRPRAARPSIEQWPIPFPERRRREIARYAERHYGRATDRLDPKTIVEHYTDVVPAQAVHDLFANDVPDVELHELPQVCSHFLVDTDGTIFQLVPTSTICRHTVGLNDVAIGIEHVGRSDDEVLGNARQLAASLRLTAWLRCRYGIAVGDVIGHNESLSSRFHHENVPALRDQTHPDFRRASMERYRARLTRLPC